MPDKWTTVAEAAAFLKVHPRTIERRISSGKIDSRRSDDGQVQVKIDMPENVGHTSDALSVVADQAESQVQLALGASTALVKQAQQDVIVARQDAERAWSEVGRARMGAWWAWSMVGVMAAASIVAVAWGTYALTAASGDKSSLSMQLRVMSDNVRQTASERDELRSQLSDARQTAARAEGEAAALRRPVTVTVLAPATQPSTMPSVIERLANSSIDFFLR